MRLFRKQKREAAFLAAPVFEGALPDGWSQQDEARNLALLYTRDEKPIASIIASVVQLGPGVDTKTYAEAQRNDRKDLPGYHELSYAEAPVMGNKRGYIHLFEWKRSDRTFTQIQQHYAEPCSGYLVTATTASEVFAEMESELRALTSRVRIPKDRSAESIHAV